MTFSKKINKYSGWAQHKDVTFWINAAQTGPDNSAIRSHCLEFDHWLKVDNASH